jgi:ADP-heptose:LPS heptosyltransferase
VALSWRSTRRDSLVLRKSAPLVDLAPLLKLVGARFVDVQYGDTMAEREAVEKSAGVRLARFDEVDYFNDLEELLAILEACDLLITTSNATAHFAGALGKRTWLLYLADRAPFHYWAHGGDHRCLWYPSVEIVSAPQFTDWNALAGHAASKLAQEIRAA